MRKLIVKLVAFLLIVGGLTASFLISKPKEEVKADTPQLYYFNIEHTMETQLSILLYVLDVANLEVDTCNMEVYLSQNSPPYSSTAASYTAQFVRDSSYDYDDYDCYRYTFVYPIYSSATPLLIILLCDHVLKLDNNIYISYHLFIPYYKTYKTYYDDGYDDGYDDAEDYYTNTYYAPDGDGYNIIFDAGEDYGYDIGFSEGADSLNTMEWFGEVTDGVSDILSLKLLPSITIGALIFIPLMFMILKGVLWIWRRN